MCLLIGWVPVTGPCRLSYYINRQGPLTLCRTNAKHGLAKRFIQACLPTRSTVAKVLDDIGVQPDMDVFLDRRLLLAPGPTVAF